MQHLKNELIEGELIDEINENFVYIHREGFIKFLHLYMNFTREIDLSLNVDISNCTNHNFPIKTEFKINHFIVKDKLEEINRFIVFFESLKVESGTIILNSIKTLKYEFIYKGNYIVKISEKDFVHMLKIITMRSCNSIYSNCIISSVVFGSKNLRFDISFSDYFKQNLYEFFKLPSELEEINIKEPIENFKKLQEYNLFNILKDLRYLDIKLISPSIEKKVEIKFFSFDKPKQ